jgi:hypothetical protein
MEIITALFAANDVYVQNQLQLVPNWFHQIWIDNLASFRNIHLTRTTRNDFVAKVHFSTNQIQNLVLLRYVQRNG